MRTSPAVPPQEDARARAASRPRSRGPTWATPGAREVSRDGGPLGGGSLGEPVRSVPSLVSTCSSSPALRVDEPERADGLERLLARVADLHRDHLVTAGEAKQRLAPVARPAEVRDDDDERTLARRSRDAGERLCELHARSAVRLVAVAQREEQADETRPALAWAAATRSVAPPKPTSPTRLPRIVAACPTARVTPSATSALRRVAVPNVIDGDRSSTIQVTRTRSARWTRTCGSVRAGGDVPVDQPDVVTRHVRPHLRELGPATEQRRAVVAGEQPVDAARDGQLERLQQALGDRPRAGTVGRRLRAECLEDPDHAAAGLPSSSRGCGTAAITASRTSSAVRSSASAW